MTEMRTPIIIATAFVLGILACAVFDRLVLPIATTEAPRSIADHWRVVEQYRDSVRNPANYRPDPQNPGLSVSTPPAHYQSSLAALAEAGELVHVDLVFPKVPQSRESNRLWMEWADKHPDVFEATGNPTYTDYAPSGERPLHLQLWFRRSARAGVQQLIRDLENLQR